MGSTNGRVAPSGAHDLYGFPLEVNAAQQRMRIANAAKAEQRRAKHWGKYVERQRLSQRPKRVQALCRQVKGWD